MIEDSKRQAASNEPGKRATQHTAVKGNMQSWIGLKIGMETSSVLIISCDDSTCDALQDCLQNCGCQVKTTSSAELGIEQAAASSPNVILCSPSLPDADPADVCRRIRAGAVSGHAPVFVVAPEAGDLTATGSTSDGRARPIDLTHFAHGVCALAESANDTRRVPDSSHLAVRGLFLDRRAFRALIDGRELCLTLTEFDILWRLADSSGAVLSRQDLSDDFRNGRPCRAVDVHILSLRSKLEDRADLIETVRGLGYRLRQARESRDNDRVATP